MEFSNSFEVSLAPEQAWPWLMDIPSIVPCMPGAELVDTYEDGSFKGKIAVRLGPVGLMFVCHARFAQVDDTARKARITAQGADAKGRGQAQAEIRLALQPSAQGSKVLVDTALELSGAVAQYGRGSGLIQNVANQIVSQFARNLEARISQLKEHAEQTGEEVFAPSAAAASALTGSSGAAAERRSSDAAADSGDTTAAMQADTQAYPGSGPAHTAAHTAASSSPAPGRAADASATATQAYTQGFQAGFAAGHAAGWQAAHALAAGGRPDATVVAGASGPRGRASGLPPHPKTKPISGMSLFASSLGRTVAGWFSRKPH